MVKVHEQPDERFTEVMLGAEIVEEVVEPAVWSAFITTTARLLRPLAAMALKHATWKERQNCSTGEGE
ncbi:Hypp6037 [Branchiostoma lanceolatum]|uniref:Hypp6037 protein n=1 Tax=Branchiostoma lanceolatum TaxID=7740 RepID=A0A8J9W0A7_BRALA|nr:Hypp6037 [Branchiostoma lanceolatum]